MICLDDILLTDRMGYLQSWRVCEIAVARSAARVSRQERSTRDLPDPQTTHADHLTELAALRTPGPAGHATAQLAPCAHTVRVVL